MEVMWLIKKHNIVKLNNDILKMKMLRAAMTNATKRKIFQRKKYISKYLFILEKKTSDKLIVRNVRNVKNILQYMFIIAK